jgi:isocitrate dehydrogenase
MVDNTEEPMNGVEKGRESSAFGLVSDRPIIPFVEGDGTGPDIWKASRRVFDAAVSRAYGGTRAVQWREVLAGEKGFRETVHGFPDGPSSTIRMHRIGSRDPYHACRRGDQEP